MKLGVAYNIFDSLELLPFSIKSVYDNVDVVVLVYSNKSNDLSIESQRDIGIYLNNIKKDIDIYNKIIVTRDEPVIRNHKLIRSFNELHKRNFGYDILKQMNCTYCMLMDCDELYKPEDFKYIKDYISDNNITNTSADLYNYYKFPEVQYRDQNNTHVSFITKIDRDAELQWNNRPNINNIDPTRKNFYRDETIYHIPLERIAMHHYSWMRKDIKLKLITSSACVNWTTKSEFIEKYVNLYNNFKIGEPFYLPSVNGTFHKISPENYTQVKNIFNFKL